MRLLWLPDILRATGLNVVEHDGWQQRGVDLQAVHGIVAHHTATSYKWSDAQVARLLRDGRRDLPGPLAQLGLDRTGRYHLIAAGKANHNGYGEWGNQSIGIEAFNDGVGEPWPTRQVDAWVAGCAAICAHLNWDASHVKGHKETDPDRKIDPAGVDMGTFRQAVTDRLNPPAPDEEDNMRILNPGDGKLYVLLPNGKLAHILTGEAFYSLARSTPVWDLDANTFANVRAAAG